MNVYQFGVYIFRVFFFGILQEKEVSHKSGTRNTRKGVFKLITVMGNEVLHAGFSVTWQMSTLFNLPILCE